MKTDAAIKRICKSCNGDGLRPYCRKCGKATPLTPTEDAAAIAWFRSLPQRAPLAATHTISDATGRIVVKDA